MEEILDLNLDKMYKDKTIKALQKARTTAGAAQLLGVSESTVTRFKRRFGLKWVSKAYGYEVQEKVFIHQKQ